MTLEKQGVGEVLLGKYQVVAVRFLDPIANLISQSLSLFAPSLGLRELAIQDQVEGKIAERRLPAGNVPDLRADRIPVPEAIPPIPASVSDPPLLPTDRQASKVPCANCSGSRPNPEADRPWYRPRRGATSGNGVFEQPAALFSAAARPEFVKRGCQIVLGHGPILRQIGPGIDLERGAISGNGVFEQPAALFSAAARPSS